MSGISHQLVFLHQYGLTSYYDYKRQAALLNKKSKMHYLIARSANLDSKDHNS